MEPNQPPMSDDEFPEIDPYVFNLSKIYRNFMDDAIIGAIYHNATMEDTTPINFSTLQQMLADLAKIPKPNVATIQAGIYITHIVPPEQGWPIAMYCPICKVTRFALTPYGTKPKDGDYFKMNDVCEYAQHTIKLMDSRFGMILKDQW